MATLGQTITVVNKSGKVVSNSKHIVNVFKEARSAYRERKAELKSARDAEFESKRNEQALLKSSKQTSTKSSHHRARDDDGASVASSRASSRATSRRSSHDGQSQRRQSEHHVKRKPPIERGYSESFCSPPHSPVSARKPRRAPTSPLHQSTGIDEFSQDRRELIRRRSDTDGLALATRRKSVPSKDVDMDLAYGDLPPPLPVRHAGEEMELRAKMTALQRMLEEANCLQHSATAMIKNLESNPDAMAAVALTLAEISNLATKMAPGALMSMKAIAPAAVALLLSPEFLIAVGVGVGVTVVALGSYKIIKKIQGKKDKKDTASRGESEVETEQSGYEDELETVDGDATVGRIEHWRRGIAEEQVNSVSTSIDGEFVTPAAAKQLRAEGKLAPVDPEKKKLKDKAREKERDAAKKTKVKADKDEKKQRDKAGKKVKEESKKRDKDTRSERESTVGGLKTLFKKDREVVDDYV